MKKLVTVIFAISFLLFAKAQTPAIIPQPVQVKQHLTEAPFQLSEKTTIYLNNPALRHIADFLNEYLQKLYGFTLPITSDSTALYGDGLHLAADSMIFKDLKGYQLTSSKEEVYIRAANPEGVFQGVQTLIQLLPVQQSVNLLIPAVDILDYPRFAYRGMHLDVSRHFFDVSFVKKYIDYLALHKMNYFHWHLTDDHGWRIEIKKYPRLTEIGAWRNGTIIGLYPGTGNDGKRYGGYYTQEEIKEVIRYASERYITIIPEIEMPGHNIAVLAAYPEFSTTPNQPKQVAQTWGIFNKFNNVLVPSDSAFRFLENVLTEVMDLFPSSYIHIGGDECSKIWWSKSAFCQNFIKKKGLKDMKELQSYFIQRIEKFVNSKGKTIIGWDEILEGGLAPNAVVMSWRGESGGIAAARQGHKVIMTPEKFLYFNHAQFAKDDSLTAARYLPLEDVYRYDPVPESLNQEAAAYIWGAQGNLWSEYVANPAKAEYMLFPRLDALSEMLWTPKSQRNYTDFLKRLNEQLKRYDLMNVHYSKKYVQVENANKTTR
ncbi:beta-N-acetylhexosaminidase [Olivibacter domesticus]|uniref:beta-N-acetylhexosaminidase n=1 Tax=Olivibacter domesticus TaxID=407022 RepID=A0A1H7JIL4_OLID1|nr:beta-N-acetylhexosaminidase [Olivibacter domesticus]SEK73800.1 hexosaminidase [Olivibacter domesticus]